jgi:hypothetical protein
MDPRLWKDNTLEVYWDGIDYLGFYHDDHGRAIDDSEARAAVAKRMLELKSEMITRIRVNRVYNQVSQGGIDLAPVWNPKMSPLLILESDGSLLIPEILGYDLLAKPYWGGSGMTCRLQSSQVQPLLLRLDVEHGRWVGSWKNNSATRLVIQVFSTWNEDSTRPRRKVYDQHAD